MPEKFLHSDYKTLFVTIADGDQEAFKSLFELFKGKVYAVAFKWTKSAYVAEEILQDVFVSIWVSREQLAEVKDPEAYLYTIIYNKLNAYLKKEVNQSAILKLFLQNANQYSNETEETIYVHDSQKFLNSAIARLSPQRKIIYELNRNEGKSYNEIAETLHISRNTVKTHLLKAVKFIRNYVKENALFLVMIATSLFPPIY